MFSHEWKERWAWLAMEDEAGLAETRRVRMVADKLIEGDIDVLTEIAHVLRSAGAGVCVSAFLVQLIFQLLPQTAQQRMASNASTKSRGNVVELVRPRKG
jgi:hypothetical protein